MQQKFVEAFEHHQLGQLQQAEKLYLEILQQAPKNADALHFLGVLYHQSGLLDRAIALIKQAISLKPDMPAYYNNLGNAYLDLKEYQEACEKFLVAIKLQPDYSGAHFNLGNVYKEMGDYKKAIDVYRKALIYEPMNNDILKNMCLAQSALYDFEGALITAQEALCLNSQDYEQLNNLANIYVKMGSFAKAHEVFEKAFACHRSDSTVCYNEALLRFMETPLKDWGSIVHDYKAMANSYEPYDYEMSVRLAMHYWSRQEREAAQNVLQKSKELFADLGAQPDQNSQNMLAYESYISAMMKLEPPKPVLSDKDAVIFIGDSHCLTYAQIGAHQTELIVGAKVWHLSGSQIKQYKKAFELALDRVPQTSSCILSFGEIDCRADEGFCAYSKKHGGDISIHIKSCVKEYVEYTSSLLRGLYVKPIYMAVPAPYLTALSLKEEDAELLIKVVQFFNEALVTEVQKVGAGFIDLYALTHTHEKRLDGHLHIDAYHLKPSDEVFAEIAKVLRQ